MAHRLAMLASELYSLPILRPVAERALARGHEVAWLASDPLAERLQLDEVRVRSLRGLRAFAPQAVFSTVHRIPPFLPGWQVQLFHGLNLHKRDPQQGHFRIQGLFDLYCTHGPASTVPLQARAREHGDFLVVETGWPKLDALFCARGAAVAMLRGRAMGRPVAMFASTFNEPLSCARECLPVLERLVARGDRYWLLTLHPMTPADLVRRYRDLAGEHASFLEADRLLDMLQAADVLVCDTSSVVEEFALLGKPVVTVRHRRPQSFMHDVQHAGDIDEALRRALDEVGGRKDAIDEYAASLHPSRDGLAAARVLGAVEALIAGRHAPAKPRRRKVWRRWWRSWRAMRELLPG